MGPIFQEVALKLLPRVRALDPKRLAQFRREAERGARLSGPSLLPVYEYGEADGILYMVMPLVRGCSLGAIIAERRTYLEGKSSGHLHPLVREPESEYFRGVAAVIARIARALEVVHAARVAHRDVKPTNILLDHGDRVFLCDFGLGRDLDVATPSQMRDGAGTPLYMAPERLLRFHADEMRADIYALGASLFEALALVPPAQVPEELAWSAWSAYLAEARPPAAPFDSAHDARGTRGHRHARDRAQSPPARQLGGGDGRRPRTVPRARVDWRVAHSAGRRPEDELGHRDSGR